MTNDDYGDNEVVNILKELANLDVSDESIQRAIGKTRSVLMSAPRPTGALSRSRLLGVAIAAGHVAITGVSTAISKLVGRLSDRRRSSLPRHILVAGALAATLLVSVLVWWGRQPAAWAEVLDAIAAKPCLHAVTKQVDGTTRELWFSPSRSALASRMVVGSGGGTQLAWLDYEQQVSEVYDPKQNTIRRTQDRAHQGVPDLFDMLFRTCLLGKVEQKTIDAGPIKLVHQQVRDVKDDEGKRWIEHRFRTVDARADKDDCMDTEWVIAVDPNTQLPFRFEQINHFKGVIPDSISRWELDYPATGPTSLYALGAPKTAKVVNEVLEAINSEAERLWSAVQASRWRPDRYYALVVEALDTRHWSQADHAYRVWRSGARWRVERSFGRVSRPWVEKLAPQDADPATWWRRKAETIQFVPERVCDGRWIWVYECKTRSATAGEIAAGVPNDQLVLVSTTKRRERPVIRPNDPGAQDDFSTAGRHGHGLPAIWNATVEMHPKSGPANTVLVEQDNPSWKPGDDPDLQYPKTWRFWIAPERSYLVMRCERLVPGVGKDGIASGYVIEELTESPDGQWYPAVVRRLRAARFSHGQTRDHIQRFYYDFSAPVPDSMFEAK